MVETASRLFQRDGYNGTSWRGLVEEAGTPWGSVHHHFPGGKEELGVAAIRFGGEAVAGLIAHCFDSQPDPASAVGRAWLSAADMEASGYTAACPVASVARDGGRVGADGHGRRRRVTAWEPIARRLRDTGIKACAWPGQPLSLILTMFEGALVRSRIERTTVPLTEAGDHLHEVLSAA